jgi:predicted MPP superfamily phosphohydrolase
MRSEELLRVALLFFSITIFLAVDLIVFSALVGELLQGKKPDKPSFLHSRWVRLLFGLLTMVFVLCLLDAFLLEPDWIELTERVHETGKIRGTLRILHLSDLHLEAEACPREKRVLELAKRLAPDLVLLTGDYLNTDGAGSRLVPFLRQLKSPLGTYAILGNYDTFHPPARYLREAGVTILRNERIDLRWKGNLLSLAGVSFGYERDMKGLIEGLPPERYTILLYHYPDLIEPASWEGYDLYLAGHIHGGQFRLPFYGALVTLSRTGKRYEAGLYRVGPTTLYVSRGIGMEGGRVPRLRFLCRPEVVLHTIAGSR